MTAFAVRDVAPMPAIAVLAGCALTVLLYLATAAALARFGIPL